MPPSPRLAAKSIAATLATAVASLASPALAQCKPTWTPDAGFLPVDSGQVFAMVTWDHDGPGGDEPWVVVGGSFLEVDGIPCQNVAAWDGKAWRSLGSGLPPRVETLAVYNGELFAGGDRSPTLDGSGAAMMRFDGEDWTPLTIGVPGSFARQVFRLGEYAGNLLVSGRVDASSPPLFFPLLSWDSQSWTVIASALNTEVWAMHLFEGDLHVGGHFTGSGSGVVSVSRWNGASWTNLSPYLDCHSLVDFEGSLYAGGFFNGISIARRSGEVWEPVGAGLQRSPTAWATVQDLVVHQGRLIAMGDFTTSAGASVSGVAAWNGVAWEALGPGTPAECRVGAVLGDDLFLGGLFPGLQRWDGTTMHEVPGVFEQGGITNLLHVPGRTIARGAFQMPGGSGRRSFAINEGNGWIPVESPTTAIDSCAAGSDWYVVRPTGLSIGGATPHVARFDGAQWHALPPPDTGSVQDIAPFGDGVVAMGSFTSIGGVSANRVAHWDGSAWSPLGAGLSSAVVVDTLIDGNAFYAVGWSMRVSSGAPPDNVIRWDGSDWQPIGQGNTLERVMSIVLHGGEPVVAGLPLPPEAGPRRSVMRWSGGQWLPVGDFLGEGVTDLHVMDDTLYAAGQIAIPGQSELCQVARWTGSAWEPVLSTVEGGAVYGIDQIGDDLAIHGSFLSVDGKPGRYIARLACAECPPDLTTTAVPGTPGYGVPNGIPNNDDFFYYLAQFAAGNLAVADLTTTAVPGAPGYGTPNGILNNDDFFYYLTIFAAGC